MNEHEVYVIGELIPKKASPDFDHINHGFISRKDSVSFRTAIKEVLVGEKVSGIWYTPGKISPKKNIEESQSDEGNQYSEKDLEEIWNKWTSYPIPKDAEEKCFDALNPLMKIFMMLFEKCMASGIVQKGEETQFGNRVGFVTTRIGRGAFMVGLEYGDIQQDSPKAEREKMIGLLEVTSEPTKSFATLLLSQLVESHQIAQDEAVKFAEELGNVIWECVIDCFKIGKAFSPKNSLSAAISSEMMEFKSTLAELKAATDQGFQWQDTNSYRQEPSLGGTDSKAIINKNVALLRNPNQCDLAAKTLIQIGEEAKLYVQPLLKDVNPDVRKNALHVLVEIEKKKF